MNNRIVSKAFTCSSKFERSANHRQAQVIESSLVNLVAHNSCAMRPCRFASRNSPAGLGIAALAWLELSAGAIITASAWFKGRIGGFSM